MSLRSVTLGNGFLWRSFAFASLLEFCLVLLCFIGGVTSFGTFDIHSVSILLYLQAVLGQSRLCLSYR